MTILILIYLAVGLIFLGYEVEKNDIKIKEHLLASVVSVLLYPVFLLVTLGKFICKKHKVKHGRGYDGH